MNRQNIPGVRLAATMSVWPLHPLTLVHTDFSPGLWAAGGSHRSTPRVLGNFDHQTVKRSNPRLVCWLAPASSDAARPSLII